MGTAEFRLLNDYQQRFPLVAAPFAALGAELGLSGDEVLSTCRRWLADGTLSRIGAVFAPRRLGASALAALSVPTGQLEEVARLVNALPEVNHNYLREHAYNLWFVVTAASAVRLSALIAGIEAHSGCAAIVLPLEEHFHIDLGFDLAGHEGTTRSRGKTPSMDTACALPPMERACALPALEYRLMAALQDGLPLVPQPYDELGRRVELSGGMVIELLERWLEDGLIRRFGLVVRHHELGFRANAMCVWDVPDDRVSEVGRRLGGEPAVTLCYRRRRALPGWPYNLFSMIHGRSRAEVEAQRDAIAARLGLDAWPHAVLFSTRRFKQQGARYLPEPVPA